MTRFAPITALLTLTCAGLLSHSIPATDSTDIEARAATITYVDEPSPAAQEIVGWAAERFVEAGLQLPDLEISFPATCGGKAGRYLVGQDQVELCRPTKTLVLHELAHAWDDNSTVDRQAFLDLRGLEQWYEQPGRDSDESGGEQLALVVAWGLMDVDITARNSERAGQPVDEQPRYLPGLDDSTPEVLVHLFVQITGSTPLSAP